MIGLCNTLCAMENNGRLQETREVNTRAMHAYFAQPQQPRRVMPLNVRYMYHPNMSPYEEWYETIFVGMQRIGCCDPLMPCREIEEFNLEEADRVESLYVVYPGCCLDRRPVGSCTMLLLPTACFVICICVLGMTAGLSLVATLR